MLFFFIVLCILFHMVRGKSGGILKYTTRMYLLNKQYMFSNTLTLVSYSESKISEELAINVSLGGRKNTVKLRYLSNKNRYFCFPTSVKVPGMALWLVGSISAAWTVGS
mmetsp:Transcript_49934/g.97716  ORF Transcript_49934/g.97716 Transcript_49934/m.97716 type:complete len:109 (+) Transcript_49934:226-552(+)